MIISASRRTDIPAFYSEWFMNRLREGYTLVPNPRNPSRLGKVNLLPDIVDCIVFWTKNPRPMFDKMDELDRMGYSYYIQFTLTPYDKSIEKYLPPKEKLIDTFVEMSQRISRKRSVWRYDPIIIDERFSVQWHIEQFAIMCEKLHRYTNCCILSFVDPYKSIGDRFRGLTNNEIYAVAAGISKIAKAHAISLFTCAEKIDLSKYGIQHGACINQSLIEQIIGSPIKAKNDTNQRTDCCCIEAVDIGAYDTCPHGCAYCYATSSKKMMEHFVATHDPLAPMIIGYPRGDEIITDRTTVSQKINQISMF